MILDLGCPTQFAPSKGKNHVAVVLSLARLVFLLRRSASVRRAVLHTARRVDCVDVRCAVCAVRHAMVQCADCSSWCAGCCDLAAVLQEGARHFQVWARRVLLCPGPPGRHVDSRRVLFGPVSRGNISGWFRLLLRPMNREPSGFNILT